jgi:hypothetical protein
MNEGLNEKKEWKKEGEKIKVNIIRKEQRINEG